MKKGVVCQQELTEEHITRYGAIRDFNFFIESRPSGCLSGEIPVKGMHMTSSLLEKPSMFSAALPSHTITLLREAFH
jgi:hypothetical protein